MKIQSAVLETHLKIKYSSPVVLAYVPCGIKGLLHVIWAVTETPRSLSLQTSLSPIPPAGQLTVRSASPSRQIIFALSKCVCSCPYRTLNVTASVDPRSQTVKNVRPALDRM